MPRLICIGAFLLFVASGEVSADPIPVLGTGHVAGSSALAPVGTIDGNFTLVSCPAGAPCVSNGKGGFDAFVTLTGGFPIPPWVANTSSAQWIGPASGGHEVTYDYRETFDLTGFNVSTVAMSGAFATDNAGFFQLNGVTVGPTSPTFNALTAFSINSGFVAGLNTLDFLVTNAPGGSGNPTGLFVEASGTGTPTTSAVPEPGSFAFFALGLGFAALLKYRLRPSA
jgi:hypothetical protein